MMSKSSVFVKFVRNWFFDSEISSACFDKLEMLPEGLYL